ncbi:MAG: AAA family ATPase [Alphaproteobacteria bacterium]|nr:AAA family ATPase [Alphaproteobacteria bacterium]
MGARSVSDEGSVTVELGPDRLARPCDPKALGFTTTADLKPVGGLIGQDRALAALDFGIAMKARGFNILAIGSRGSGRHNAIRRFIEGRAADQQTPDDWVYVHNFEEPYRPKVLRLPPGQGTLLKAALDELVIQLKGMLPAVFESADYRDRRAAIDEEFEAEQQNAFKRLAQKAEAQNMAILHTPTGIVIVPTEGGKPIHQSVVDQMAPAKREQLEARIKALGEELGQTMRSIPERDKMRRQRIQALNREMAEHAVASVRHLTDDSHCWFGVR